MAFIVEQFVGDRALQLGNEEFVRPLSFGTNWQKLRVGVHWAMNGSSTLPVLTARLGFCTGNLGWFGSPIDSIAISLFGNVAGLYSGTPPNNYYQATSPSQTVFQNNLGVITNVANSMSFSNPAISAYPTTNRSAYFFTLAKGVGTAVTVQLGGTLSTQANTDISRSTFLTQMESETTAITGLALSTNTATTLGGGTAQLWDGVFVNWVRCVPTITINEICVVRYA